MAAKYPTNRSEMQQQQIGSRGKVPNGMLSLPMVDNEESRLQAFAAQVRSGMTRNGLGVGDVSKALGVTPEMARRYREGIAMPKPEKLAKLARLLGMSEAELLFGQQVPGARSATLQLLGELTPDEQNLIETYRALPEYGRKALRARAAELLEHFGAASKKNPFGKGGTQ